MINGWIKLHRSLLDWEWRNIPEMVAIFVYCLLRARTNDGKWQNIPLKRGQLLVSIASLSRETGVSVQRTRTCLERLQSTCEITTESTNKYTIITICKYDNYQSISDMSNKQSNIQATDKQQTTNKQNDTPTTTNKEYKEERNKRKISTDVDKKKSSFSPPSIEEVENYISEKGYQIDAESFCAYYESVEWMVGKKQMKDWKASVRLWARRAKLKQTESKEDDSSLGIGERRNESGKRTYGIGAVIVPENAPPRPSANSWWSETTGQWENSI